MELYLSTHAASGLKQREPLRLSGVLLMQTIFHIRTFSPTSGNKCPGHKYITTESCSYVRYAQGIRSEFHIGMLVEKSTFPQRWRTGVTQAEIRSLQMPVLRLDG